MLILALIPLLFWCLLLTARGGFWRVQKQLAPRGMTAPPRSIAVIIPARDEAEYIGKTVSSLKSQDFHAPIEIVVVDDNSIDETALAARDAGATVIAGKPLEAGWTGKLWALSQGIAEAETRHPDFLLFTDADITHDPGSLHGTRRRRRSWELRLNIVHGQADLPDLCRTSAHSGFRLLLSASVSAEEGNRRSEQQAAAS